MEGFTFFHGCSYFMNLNNIELGGLSNCFRKGWNISTTNLEFFQSQNHILNLLGRNCFFMQSFKFNSSNSVSFLIDTQNYIIILKNININRYFKFQILAILVCTHYQFFISSCLNLLEVYHFLLQNFTVWICGLYHERISKV